MVVDFSVLFLESDPWLWFVTHIGLTFSPSCPGGGKIDLVWEFDCLSYLFFFLRFLYVFICLIWIFTHILGWFISIWGFLRWIFQIVIYVQDRSWVVSSFLWEFLCGKWMFDHNDFFCFLRVMSVLISLILYSSQYLGCHIYVWDFLRWLFWVGISV